MGLRAVNEAPGTAAEGGRRPPSLPGSRGAVGQGAGTIILSSTTHRASSTTTVAMIVPMAVAATKITNSIM